MAGNVTVPEALKVCELHREHRYDLILLNLDMPGTSGIEVLEGLREIEADGPLPVLAIAALAGDRTRAMPGVSKVRNCSASASCG